MFSNIDQALNLMSDSMNNEEAVILQLEELKRNSIEQEQILNEKEASIAEQERLLLELRQRLEGMSQIYREQSILYEKSAASSRFWKRFSLIALPVAALLSGGITALVTAGQR
jgi:hypothetical protein